LNEYIFFLISKAELKVFGFATVRIIFVLIIDTPVIYKNKLDKNMLKADFNEFKIFS
jgi:hypothetical protein